MTIHICVVCGTRTKKPHRHHPALEENFPDFTAEACGPCHNGPEGLTARQWDTGMLRDHNLKDRPREPRPEPERSFDLIVGTADLLAESLRACAIQMGNRDLARQARLLRIFAPFASRTVFLAEAGTNSEIRVPLGPEPAKNRRRWRRRPVQRGGFERRVLAAKGQVRCPLVGRMRGAVLLLRDHSRIAGEMFSAGGSEVGARLAAAQQRYTDALEAVLQHPLRVLRGVLVLERTGLMDRLEPAMRRLLPELEHHLLQAASASDEEALSEALLNCGMVLAPLEREFCSFVADLAAGADPQVVGLRLLEALESAA